MESSLKNNKSMDNIASMKTKQAVAIVGTYRKGKVIDSAVRDILRGLESAGMETSTVHLLDVHLEFCTNCRACTQEPGDVRGKCVLNDDLEAIWEQIDKAEVVVLASPINFGTVTSLMKRFVERLICTAYWPWNSHPFPKARSRKKDKYAVLVTSSACPGFIGRWLMPGAIKVQKQAAQCLRAKVSKTLYFGSVADTQEEQLKENGRRRAYAAGQSLGVRVMR